MGDNNPIWLDVDPGHDDATAILLSLKAPGIDLLGISTTHGNAPSDLTALNAARCLVAFGAPENIMVFPGAPKPLLRPPKHDPEIHGPDGLGGVEGLPEASDPRVTSRIAKDEDGESIHAIEGMVTTIKAVWKSKRRKITIVATGPLTNTALFAATYPDLTEQAIQEIVFMGGGVGVGNRGAAAEYNILCDPHAAQITLNSLVKVVMVPLNVTHTAIVTHDIHLRILGHQNVHNADTTLPAATSPIRHTLSTAINFFADSYKSTFGFNDGPPLHDALTIAYVSRPSLFTGKRYRVDVELTGEHSLGETVVDVWNYRTTDDSWGPNGKNCFVTEKLDVPAFWDFFMQVHLNKTKVEQ
ncbi:uridine nucleosidase [Flagelloscypha sp. PMI_526]|nr:uridine nucleosidase [Flagelloscypha sp. PMI_526]